MQNCIKMLCLVYHTRRLVPKPKALISKALILSAVRALNFDNLRTLLVSIWTSRGLVVVCVYMPLLEMLRTINVLSMQLTVELMKCMLRICTHFFA